MLKTVLAASALSLTSIAAVHALADEAKKAPPEIPGTLDSSRITGGTYQVDPLHTLIQFEVDHLGFNPYFGIFGNPTGTLVLDPAKPDEAKVDITIPIGKVMTTSEDLTKHLLGTDFFAAEEFPEARFTSTKVTVDGMTAEIVGDLTVRGVTRPVTLEAQFTGAGANPMSKAETVGFSAITTVKRSDFGVDFGIPMVSDTVDLRLTAAFEKPAEQTALRR